MSSEKFDVHRFDGKDFSLWKFQMKIFLLGQDLWDVVDGTTAKPGEGGAEQLAWIKKDRRAMMYLTQALAKNQLSYVVNCDTSNAIWERLMSIHEQKNKTSIHMVQAQFYEYKMDSKDDVATHITKVESLARRLKDMGEAPTESAIITKILCSLPSCYRGLLSAWDSTPENEQTLANLTARLLKEQEVEKKMEKLSLSEERNEALVAQGKRASSNSSNRRPQHQQKGNKKFAGECYHCKKVGHREADCWAKHPDKRKQKSAGAANVSEEDGPSALMADSDGGLSGIWVADSGASQHMSSQKNLFQDFAPITSGTYPIRIANKSVMQCMGIGSLHLRSKVGKKWSSITLLNVLFVPELGRNLFSVSAASKNGAKITFGDKDCQVYKNKRLVAEGKAVGKLYYLNVRPIPGTEANLSDAREGES